MSDEKLVEMITNEVLKRMSQISAGAEAGPAASKQSEVAADSGPVILPHELAPYIDHTLLKPEATREDFDRLCDEAIANGFYSVCVNSSWVAHCARRLQGSAVKVCAVVGFPLGAMAGRAKNFETRHAIEAGANEIDMVINVGALKSGDLKTVEDDIRWVRRACTRNIVLKVIIEAALLNDEQKVIASRIAVKAGADFVKTSTGFSHHGATVHDVRLMRRTVGDKIGVKAAGGVRSYKDAVEMIQAGATRLGTSAGVKLVAGETTDSTY